MGKSMVHSDNMAQSDASSDDVASSDSFYAASAWNECKWSSFNITQPQIQWLRTERSGENDPAIPEGVTCEVRLDATSTSSFLLFPPLKLEAGDLGLKGMTTISTNFPRI